MTSRLDKIKAYFSEIVIISSFVSYIVLVLTDFSGIISRVLDGSQPLSYLLTADVWIFFALTALKNFVWLLIGIFTKALKNIYESAREDDKASLKKLQEVVIEYQTAAFQSSDPKMLEVAKNSALALINAGVDLYNVASGCNTPATAATTTTPTASTDTTNTAPPA